LIAPSRLTLNSPVFASSTTAKAVRLEMPLSSFTLTTASE